VATASSISSFLLPRWRQLSLTAIVVIILSATYLVFFAANTNSHASERAVIIPRGASFKTVLDSLQASGVIRVRWTLDLAGRTLGRTKSVKFGKYLFPRGLSNVGILNDLAEGKSRVLVQVLIPEGQTSRD
jgi:cell division protein YceG involved in septum cleavage